MKILIDILNNRENRIELIRQFQEYIWNENPQFKDTNEENILYDLAYDLDFYQVNIERRKEDISYYGDERLEKEIKSALAKLGIEYI